jgi:XTP/dITP diphosphohydrolase
MTTLLLATRNGHKVQEIRSILGDEFDYLTLNEYPGAPHAVEDADSFAGNATRKAVQLAGWLSRRQPATPKPPSCQVAYILADDSGLEVDALKGAPGVHSARFDAIDSAGSHNSPDAANNRKLLRLLEEVPAGQRGARFRCVIAVTPVPPPVEENSSPVCYANEVELQTELFTGTCEGRIDFHPGGQGGFGYDPLFIPDGYDVSFAELGEDVKNKLSHRAKALAKVRQYLLAVRR